MSWRAELRLACVMGALLFLVSLVPYLLGYLYAPPGKVFNGFFYIADDATTYLSKMREGADGAWGWSDPYISKPVASPVGLFLFYIAWGKVAGLVHLPLVAVYHVARLTGSVALVAAARALARLCLPGARARRLALALVLTGSGVGFVVALAGRVDILGHQLEALDLHLPELSGFYSVLAIPHFAWAAALMAASIVALVETTRSTGARRRWAAAAASLLMLLLCVIHPQMLFILAPLAAVYLVAARAPAGAWPWCAVPFMVCAPLLLYFLSVLTGDAVVAAWSRQWKHQAPEVISLVLALGIPLALAVYSVARRHWLGSPELTVLVAWVGIVLVVLYLPNPVNIQRRLLDGIFIPVALLAALGIEVGWRRFGRTVVAVSAISSLVVIGLGIDWSLTRQPFLYVGSGEVAAMDWLGQHRAAGLAQAVLSHPDTGLFIPAIAGDRVYVGHYSETIDYAAHVQRARFAIAAGGSELETFMRQEGISLFFYGPRERGLGGPGPSGSGGLHAVYDRDGVTIFRLDGS